MSSAKDTADDISSFIEALLAESSAKQVSGNLPSDITRSTAPAAPDSFQNVGRSGSGVVGAGWASDSDSDAGADDIKQQQVGGSSNKNIGTSRTVINKSGCTGGGWGSDTSSDDAVVEPKVANSMQENMAAQSQSPTSRNQAQSSQPQQEYQSVNQNNLTPPYQETSCSTQQHRSGNVSDLDQDNLSRLVKMNIDILAQRFPSVDRDTIQNLLLITGGGINATEQHILESLMVQRRMSGENVNESETYSPQQVNQYSPFDEQAESFLSDNRVNRQPPQIQRFMDDQSQQSDNYYADYYRRGRASRGGSYGRGGSAGSRRGRSRGRGNGFSNNRQQQDYGNHDGSDFGYGTKTFGRPPRFQNGSFNTQQSGGYSGYEDRQSSERGLQRGRGRGNSLDRNRRPSDRQNQEQARYNNSSRQQEQARYNNSSRQQAPPSSSNDVPQSSLNQQPQKQRSQANISAKDRLQYIAEQEWTSDEDDDNDNNINSSAQVNVNERNKQPVPTTPTVRQQPQNNPSPNQSVQQRPAAGRKTQNVQNSSLWVESSSDEEDDNRNIGTAKPTPVNLQNQQPRSNNQSNAIGKQTSQIAYSSQVQKQSAAAEAWGSDSDDEFQAQRKSRTTSDNVKPQQQGISVQSAQNLDRGSQVQRRGGEGNRVQQKQIEDVAWDSNSDDEFQEVIKRPIRSTKSTQSGQPSQNQQQPKSSSQTVNNSPGMVMGGWGSDLVGDQPLPPPCARQAPPKDKRGKGNNGRGNRGRGRR